MAAVGAVEQVMRAVGALALAQQAAAEEAASEASTWLSWVEELLARLAGEPVLGASTETLWVVVGPERPICGALPRTLLAQVPPDGVVGLVGGRLAEAAREVPGMVERTRFVVPAAATADELGHRAEALAGAILAHGQGRALVLMHPDQGGATLVRSVLVAGRRPPSERPTRVLRLGRGGRGGRRAPGGRGAAGGGAGGGVPLGGASAPAGDGDGAAGL